MQRLPLAVRDFWSRLKDKNSNNTECVLIWNRPSVSEGKRGKKEFISAEHVGRNISNIFYCNSRIYIHQFPEWVRLSFS